MVPHYPKYEAVNLKVSKTDLYMFMYIVGYIPKLNALKYFIKLYYISKQRLFPEGAKNNKDVTP